MDFINLLNESSVTYIPNVARYGWAVIDQDTVQDGWEAISPFGEITCHDSRAAAHRWRVQRVLEYMRETA